MNRLLIIALLSFFILGCSDLNKSLGLEPEGAWYLPPNDEATPAEKDRISSTLTTIETIANELGYSGHFRKLPIIVTTEDSEKLGRVGYCHWTSDRKDEFIVINRVVFNDTHLNERASYLFRVLLHEIGHCYFRRGHGTQVFKKDGHNIIVEVVDYLGGSEFFFDQLPVSIMNIAHNEDVSSLRAVPKPLQKYYVSEIIGQTQIQSVEDLATIPGLKFVQKP